MMTDVKTLFIYTESPLHAGTGSGLGAVDLPIQREQTTGYPMIQGSGVKGALRSQSTATDDDKRVVFGPDNQVTPVPDFAGAAAFGDARILLFPVRALNGVFVWTTCESILARFVRDCQLATLQNIPSTGKDSAGLFDKSIAKNDKIVLEEYIYTTREISAPAQGQQSWAQWLAANVLPDDGQNGVYTKHYKPGLEKRLVILPDNDFRDFTLYATQIVTRVALDDAKKTVSQGPFTMELLPADTVLYSPITAQNPRGESASFPKGKKAADVLAWFNTTCFKVSPPRIQIGGDETVGYGRVALRWGN
jgi:CRISPR-associated protein Cmr4